MKRKRSELRGARPVVQKLRLRLPLRRRPLGVLVFEAALDPRDGDGGPDAGPEEGEDPANL